MLPFHENYVFPSFEWYESKYTYVENTIPCFSYPLDDFMNDYCSVVISISLPGCKYLVVYTPNWLTICGTSHIFEEYRFEGGVNINIRGLLMSCLIYLLVKMSRQRTLVFHLSGHHHSLNSLWIFNVIFQVFQGLKYHKF